MREMCNHTLKKTENDAEDLLRAIYENRGEPEETGGRCEADVATRRDNLYAVTHFDSNRLDGFAKGSGALCALGVSNRLPI